MRFTKLVSSARFLHRRIYDGRNGIRTYSAPAPEVGEAQKKCCVICCYEQNNQLELTPAAAELDQKCGGKISQQLNTYVCDLHLGKAFAITGILDYSAVAITSIGPKNAGYNELESLDEARENIRWGVGAGVRLLKERGGVAVEVDPCSAPDAAAEAAELAAWRFEVFKSAEGRKPACHVSELGGADSQLWLEGAIRGRAQNWARCLSDMPANKMTPVDLAQCALDRLCPLGVEVEAYDRDWVEAQGMRAFLAVARGSCDTAVFLQCVYRGARHTVPPVLLAAKGVTFDSGGLCLKECHSMTENRGSMAGAAVVLAAFEIIAKLKLPINVTGVIPICENMVSGQCMKVGDVVQALNGMSIQIENTDMEGRLMMADALVYGQSLCKPSLVIDVATFTQGVLMATGGGAFGCFSNSEGAWHAAQCAGAASGDRPWRFPLWGYFHKQITNDPSVDLRNQGSGRATPCLGAAFLKNFICGDWLHMDITGVGKVAHSGAPPYLDTRRMTGRPARTLAVLLQHLAAAPPLPPTPPCTPTSHQGPQPWTPVYPTDPKPCPPVYSPIDPKPYPPVCRPIDPKPCPPVGSPIDPKPCPPVYSPIDPKPYPPVCRPIDPKPCPPVGSPIDPKPCPPVYSPIDPKPYPPVCRPIDPKPCPPVGSPIDPKPCPPVYSPIDPKPYPPVCRPIDPKPCPPVYSPIDPKPYPPVCRPIDPKPCPPVYSPIDPKPYPPVCRPTDPKPYPPVGSPIDPKPYPSVCRPTEPKPCPPIWYQTDPKPHAPVGSPIDPKPCPPVCRSTDPEPYPPVGSSIDPKPCPPVCRPTDPKPYPPGFSPIDPKPCPPVCRPTDPKPYPPGYSPIDPKTYPPVCRPTDPKPYPPVGSSIDAKPCPPVCRPTDPKPYPPVGSPIDPKPCPPVCSPTDPKPCPPVCCPPAPTCAPKPQICPPSTETCAPNPQTCVPPMKHKCN